MKKVILFLNGEKPIKYPGLKNYEKIFCTDGAINYLIKDNIYPDILSGDMDSKTIDLSSITNNIKIINTPDQNYTDFEKALKIIINLNYNQVDVYGASGKEQDHFLGNLTTAYKYKSKLKITFYDNYSKYFFSNNYTIIKNKIYKNISLMPFYECHGITTNGIQYQLTNESLEMYNRVGTRNKIIYNKASIEYKSGELIIFIEH